MDCFEGDVDFVDLLDEGYRLEKHLMEASLGSYEDYPRVFVQILHWQIKRYHLQGSYWDERIRASDSPLKDDWSTPTP